MWCVCVHASALSVNYSAGETNLGHTEGSFSHLSPGNFTTGTCGKWTEPAVLCSFFHEGVKVMTFSGSV